MPLENSMSAKISNQELLIDIANTLKEIQAHEQIAEGFRVLAWLPEQSQRARQEYLVKVQFHQAHAGHARKSLALFEQLKEERGL